jgi:hypothetical protein
LLNLLTNRITTALQSHSRSSLPVAVTSLHLTFTTLGHRHVTEQPDLHHHLTVATPSRLDTMALSGFLFLSWRIFEIIILIPIMGMLAWFVHQYVHANQLTPAYILVLFIVSVIALAWAIFTLIDYVRARHDALFVAFIDLCIVGGLIAGVYYLRGWGTANCTNVNADLYRYGFSFNISANKQCVMLKASFALAIIAILAFFVTFVSSETCRHFIALGTNFAFSCSLSS